ncbi:hypothetical protein HF086_017284 [Spodoptera exigua]|uniref:Uncharacterized protein n=1 Tax=Spodoptera exigua TaxID=7107 RepID=A0A922M0J0_SPOEX|nr:hypothetical protein HF086_017284 [Spodoptera exigua]
MKIKNKRNEVSTIEKFRDREVYNVIDKLEKVILKDDMYLAGDFDTNDLENDFFYSSDDLEDFIDDSTSEPDDSGDEVYGSLPPEPRFGNLKWRLRSGGGSAVYVLGVRDCGALVGLRARALRGSLFTLRRMAGALGATLTHVTARRVAPHRAVAEVYVRKCTFEHVPSSARGQEWEDIVTQSRDTRLRCSGELLLLKLQLEWTGMEWNG